MKYISALVGSAILVLLIAVVPAAANSFELTGSGTKIREHSIGNVPPGESITVRIVNSRPGYAAFSLYLSGEDLDDEDEVILDYRARRGLVCAVAGGCVTTLENTSNSLTADELAVVGIKGASGARATVTHCAGVCTPP